jgi:hypothetical protein
MNENDVSTRGREKGDNNSRSKKAYYYAKSTASVKTYRLHSKSRKQFKYGDILVMMILKSLKYHRIYIYFVILSECGKVLTCGFDLNDIFKN